MSTPRPSGGSQLHNSDPISNRQNTHKINVYNSFTGVVGEAELQNPTGPETGHELSGTDDSTPILDTTKFYPGEIPFRNQGTSTSPPQHMEQVEIQKAQVNTQRETSGTQTTSPVVTETTRNLPPQPNMGKGGKRKSSQNVQTKTQPQPSTSNGGTNPTLAFQPRNLGTGRPHVQCSACGGNDHFRKDCQQDNFCTRCRSRSHATHMCRVPINTGRNNNICVYCGSTHHTSGNCTSQPNDNREEPRSTPWDLHSHGPYYGANTEYSGVPRGNTWNSTNSRPASAENSGNYIPAGQQVYTNNTNVSFPYRDYRYDQNRTGCQQTRFDERYNRQYSPNYNYNHYQPSPPVSVAGPDLSTTLIDLAISSPDPLISWWQTRKANKMSTMS